MIKLALRNQGHHAGGLLIRKLLDDLRTTGVWARRPVHPRDGECAVAMRDAVALVVAATQ
jgi:hypothetical protein